MITQCHHNKPIDRKVKENRLRNLWSFFIFLLLVVVCIGIHLYYTPESAKMRIRPQLKQSVIIPAPKPAPHYAGSPETP